MLVLLADTRKKLLWLWLGFTAFIVLLIFMQTLSGKFEGIEARAWVWTFVNLLPALLLLLVAVLLNKNPSKVLLRATFWTVYAAALAYLLMLILTLFVLPLATSNWSIEDYFNNSYLWLLPFQAILLLAFSVLYFRKETLFRPNANIMLQYVSKKREFAQRSGNDAQLQAFDLLQKEDGLGAALSQLRTNLKSQESDIVILQGQFAEWIKQRDLNLLPPDALQRELNRMTITAVDYIEKL